MLSLLFLNDRLFNLFFYNSVMFCLLLQILVLNTDTQELVASFRVTTGTSNTTAIKSIEFARKGRWEPAGGTFVYRTQTYGFSPDWNSSVVGFVFVLAPSLFPPMSLIVLCFCSYALLFVQLFPHKHSRPHHQGIWRQGDTDLWQRRWTRTHAEAAGLGEQVLQTRS